MSSWVTIRGAAAHAAVSVRTIRGWIDDGRLPASRMGRIVRVSTQDIDDLLQRHMVQAGAAHVQRQADAILENL